MGTVLFSETGVTHPKPPKHEVGESMSRDKNTVSAKRICKKKC